MKKIIAVMTAAMCFASVATFSACGEKKSDEVTAEEWASAMTASNALNVTMSGTMTATTTVTTDGVTETTTGISDIVVKTALSISVTNITGNTYLYAAVNSSSDDESEEGIFTEYEVFSEDSYSYVEKEVTKITETDSTTGELTETNDIDWYGRLYSTAGTPTSSEAYTTIRELYSEISDEYDDFEYVDGAYRYYPDEEDTSNVAYVKINNGKLVSIVLESAYDYSYGNISYTYYYKYDLKFSDYGSTSVTVPEEFTYEYYYLNYVL